MTVTNRGLLIILVDITQVSGRTSIDDPSDDCSSRSAESHGGQQGDELRHKKMSEQSDKKKDPRFSEMIKKNLPTYLLCFLFIQYARKQTHTPAGKAHHTHTKTSAGTHLPLVCPSAPSCEPSAGLYDRVLLVDYHVILI